jgi:hypothetical protein
MHDTQKQFAELGLLALAFFFAIPTPTSTTESYPLTPTLAFAGIAYAGSVGFALSRKAETWPFAAGKVIVFLIFATVTHFAAIFAD